MDDGVKRRVYTKLCERSELSCCGCKRSVATDCLSPRPEILCSYSGSETVIYMIIKDKIYGKFKIHSLVIVDLIKSKPFQRLKNISQDGAPHYIQPERDVSRYEHSIGVWFLSNKLKRGIEEQIACLLHDIPHTAFSHVIDIVMDDPNHEFHEKFMETIIYNSEIPKILKKYNIDIKKVLNVHKFPLLENSLPDISVDRWDYFMRDGYTMGFLPIETVNLFLNNIFIDKEKLYFKNVRVASLFSILFVNFSRLIWLDPTSHGSFYLIASAIKIGVKKGLISNEDLFTDDLIMMEKLRKTKDPDILKFLSRLSPKREFVYASKEEAEFYGQNKPRFVDPLVRIHGKFIRTSKLVHSIGYMCEEFKKSHKMLGVTQLVTK